MAQVQSTKNATRARRLGLMTVLTALGGLFVVFTDEFVLAGPIVLLTHFFGLWWGGVIFSGVWAALGLLALEVVTRKGLFKSFFVKSPFMSKKNLVEVPWRDRLVLKTTEIARGLGALVTAVILGPIFGWPAFKWLGYSKNAVYGWTLAAAPIFALVWVPIYGGVGFLVFKLF